jgi:uncharacterized protein (DUF2164 family)
LRAEKAIGAEHSVDHELAEIGKLFFGPGAENFKANVEAPMKNVQEGVDKLGKMDAGASKK